MSVYLVSNVIFSFGTLCCYLTCQLTLVIEHIVTTRYINAHLLDYHLCALHILSKLNAVNICTFLGQYLAYFCTKLM